MIFVSRPEGKEIALNCSNHAIAVMKVLLDNYWLAPSTIALIVSIYGCTSTSPSFQTKPPLPTSPQSSGDASKKSNSSADSSSSNAPTRAKPMPTQEGESESAPGKSFSKQLTDKGDRGDSTTKSAIYVETKDGDSPSIATTPKTDAETLDDIDSELNASIAAFERRLAREKQPVGQSSLRELRQQLPEGDADSHGALDARHRDTNSTGAGLIPASPAEQHAPAVGNRPAQKSRQRAALDRGDEVLERQLRDAAERESDSQLRRKLWEEYRKYTGRSTQVTGK